MRLDAVGCGWMRLDAVGCSWVGTGRTWMHLGAPTQASPSGTHDRRGYPRPRRLLLLQDPAPLLQWRRQDARQ